MLAVVPHAGIMAAHTPLIGDCSDLPYSKDTILYAIAWVGNHYEEMREETEDETLAGRCDDLNSTLSYLLTRLVNDWHTIDPQDKDAIVKLNRCESFPDWALPLQSKYSDDEKASKEAADVTIQVMLDQVKRRKSADDADGRKYASDTRGSRSLRGSG